MIKVYSSTDIYIQVVSYILLVYLFPVLREGGPHWKDFIPTTLSLEGKDRLGKDRLKCCRGRKGVRGNEGEGKPY